MSEIKLQYMTPRPYYEQSRDFQFIGRLFDIVLNSVKTNADMMYNLPLSADTDERLADLMALTLGFELKHSYPAKQLKAVCSVLPTIMRQKGSVKAIETAVRAILGAEGVKGAWKCDADPKTAKATIIVPSQLSDLRLLRDLLDYVLPAGMDCELCKMNFTVSEASTLVGTYDEVRKRWIRHKSIATVAREEPHIYRDDNELESGYAMLGEIAGSIEDADVVKKGDSENA